MAPPQWNWAFIGYYYEGLGKESYKDWGTGFWG
jgi:hypothetical protein